MKRTNLSLRETLDALTAALVGGILAAARESLREMHAEPAPAPRKQRLPRRTGAQSRARTVDREPAAYEDMSPAGESPNELVITDPSALLAALETSDSEAEPHAAPPAEPEILRPVSAPKPVFVPALRAGEEVMRASSSAVVLRRRRV